MSIKLKIAIWFSVFTSIFLLCMGGVVYYFALLDRQQSFKNRLLNRAVSSARVYADSIDKKNTVMQKIDSAAIASLYGKSVTIMDDRGTILYTYNAIPGDILVPDTSVIEKTKMNSPVYFTSGGKNGVAIQYRDNYNIFLVSIAAKDQDGEDLLQGLKKIIITVFFIGMLLTFLLGYVFAMQLVKPISRITQQVNRISHLNLSTRIHTRGNKDEWYHLTATFNHLLDRLQESFSIQRKFISNASHELSTPLTSVSSQLEVAMQKKRSVMEYEQVMTSVYEDVQEMQQLTRTLLEIARTGNEGSIDLAVVRVDEVVMRVIANVEKQNPQYKVRLNFGELPDTDNPFSVFGNADLLYTAIKNIIENACKYSDDKYAFVDLVCTERKVTITIYDKGVIIDETDSQNIFHPFFRAKSALSKPGFGLGLTLAKRIIQLHKGDIEMKSSPNTGTHFTIVLPSLGMGIESSENLGFHVEKSSQ